MCGRSLRTHVQNNNYCHHNYQSVCELVSKKMKVAILLFLVGLTAAKFNFPQEWEDWKKKYEKNYQTSEEEIQRHIIWEANKKYVESHNEHADVFGFTLEVNEFSDLVCAND